MHALDRLIPMPRLLEIDEIEIAAPADIVWKAVRHADLARSLVIRALLAPRALPARFGQRLAALEAHSVAHCSPAQESRCCSQKT